MPTFLSPVGLIGAAANGRLTVGTNTTASDGGLWLGTDVNLYRSGADTLKTDDAFVVTGGLTASGYDVVMPAMAGDSTNEPGGFESRTTSTLSLVDAGATYTFTIAPTGANFPVWIQGVRQLRTTESLTIAKTTGSVFVYYNSAGVLSQSGTPWTLGVDTPIALIYYSATAGAAIMCEERHGCVMDASTHYYLHTSRGAQLGSGCALGDYVVQPGSPTNANNRWSVSSGSILDEDLTHTISGLVAGGPYTVMRRTGATEWTWSTENDPYIMVGGKIAYNSYSGGVWGQTAVPNHDFSNMWVFVWGTTSAATQVLVVQGQNFYTTLSAAQAATIETSLDISLYPFIECVARYQVTMRREDSYSNTTGACRIEAVTQLVQRSLAVSGQLAATNHATLSNRNLPDQHPAAAVTNTPAGNLSSTDVQSALNELDTEKAALSGAALTGTYAQTLAATTTDAFTAKVTGDAANRWVANADGALEWGSGSGAVDTNLYRSSADVLKTDDALVVGGSYASIGANTADSGSLRLPNNQTIVWRNAANNGNAASMYADLGDHIMYTATNWHRFWSGGSEVFDVKPDSVASTLPWVTTGSYLSVGTAPAQSGSLRLPNNTSIFWRNAANDADLQGWGINASNELLTYRPSVSIGTNPAAGGTIRLPTSSSIKYRNAANNADLFLASFDDNTTYLYGGTTVQVAIGGVVQTVMGATYLSLGATPASTGYLRLPSNTSIKWRNAADNADLALLKDASDVLNYSGTSFAIGTNPASAGALRLANNQKVMWRNAANTEDSGAVFYSSDNCLYHDAATYNYFRTGTSIACSIFNSGGYGEIDTPNIHLRLNTWSTGNVYVGMASTGGLYIKNWTRTGSLGVGTDALAYAAIAVGGTITNAAGGTIGLYMGSATLDSADGQNAFFLSPSGSINTAGPKTINVAESIVVGNITKAGAGTINSVFGIAVEAQTAGAANYGIAIQSQSTQTLWIGNNADNTTAAAGLAFGSSRDTNLYRSAADTLKTDDALVVGGSYVAVGTSPAATGHIRLPNSGYVASRNAANDSQFALISGSASNQVAIAEGGHTTAIGGGVNVAGAWVAIGTTPAASGALRLPNNTAIVFRNAANSGDQSVLSFNGSDVLSLGGSNTAVYGGGNLSFTVNNSGGIDISARAVTGASSISVGTNPAGAGILRLPNNTSIAFRNAANSADINAVNVDSANDINFYGTSYTRFMFGAAQKQVCFSTGQFWTGDSVLIGTNYAQSGAVRVANNVAALVARNAANSGDIEVLGVTSSNQINLAYGGTQVNCYGALGVQNYIASTQYVEAPYVALGTNYAQTGTIRLPNNVSIYSRNAANSADLRLMQSDGSNNTLIAAPSGGPGIYLQSDTTSIAWVNESGLTLGSTRNLVVGGTYVAIGTNPAAAGAVRVPNNTKVAWRNYTNDGDAGYIMAKTTDLMVIGQGGVDVMTLFGGTSVDFADAIALGFSTSTGSKIGATASQKLAFWGATAVVRPASASQAAVSTTGSTNSSPYGFTTAAQADGIVTLLNEIRNVLVTIGLMKGAA